MHSKSSACPLSCIAILSSVLTTLNPYLSYLSALVYILMSQSFCLQSIASADMDQAQLEAFLTAQTRKQGGGGLNPEQAAALSRFWKAHRARVRENLLSQSRWEPGLRGLKWRVDLHTSSSRGQLSNSPVALVELELGCTGEVRWKKTPDKFLLCPIGS